MFDNDSGGETDHPEGRLLDANGAQVGRVDNPGGGFFEVHNTNQITFTLEGFAGPGAMVQYVVIDDNNGSGTSDTSNVASATFSLPNYAPTAGALEASVVEGQPVGASSSVRTRDPRRAADVRFVERRRPRS